MASQAGTTPPVIMAKGSGPGHNESEPSFEGELDSLKAPSLADYEILLADESEEETDFDFGDDEPLPEVKEEMEGPSEQQLSSPHPEDQQPSSPSSSSSSSLGASATPEWLTKYDNVNSPSERSMAKYLRHANEGLYNALTNELMDQHTEAAASYADFRALVEESQEQILQATRLADKQLGELTKTFEETTTGQHQELANLLKAIESVQEQLTDDPKMI